MDFKKHTLSNNLRVILAPMNETQTVTVVVTVSVGSRYETQKQAGLSHFLEHMLFKGTKKRPTTLAISEELDTIGGEYNAFTGKNRTMYYVKTAAKHLNTALDVVSDMYLRSKLEVKEIKREKGTIVQEISMYEDTPMRYVGEVFETLLYGNAALGKDTAGTKQSVSSFTQRMLSEYMSKHYSASNTVVCVTGNIQPQAVLRKIKGYFSKLRSGNQGKYESVADKQREPKVRIKFKKTDQTHCILGVRAYDMFHADRYALSLLATILGGNMSSRLFIQVRERRGLAYYVNTSTEQYQDVGYFATQTGVEHRNLLKAIEVILREYRKTVRQNVSDKELNKAKDYVMGKIVMSLESSDEVAEFLAGQEIMRKEIKTLPEIFAEINKVTPDDIRHVAKDIFVPKKLNLAVIGPHKNARMLEKILRR